MATVGVIVINYRADPEPLFRSIAPSRHDVRWYIFLHGQDPALKRKVDALAEGTNSRYYPYGVNRGVARSWNEGLRASLDDGNDVTMMVNDDMFFYEGGFDKYVDFIVDKSLEVPNFGVITVYGMETGTAGGVGSSGFYMKSNWQGGACMAIGRRAVEEIGYFDQNLWPAYYEDADYFYRLELQGLPILSDERTLLEHNRSYALRTDPLLYRLHGVRLRRNEHYYLSKWGGLRQWGGPDAEKGSETLAHPFGDETIGWKIPREQIDAPYGRHDRTDLKYSATLGLLEGDPSEDLLSLLSRHAPEARRLLVWGMSDDTPVFCGFAAGRQAELLLLIDHRTDQLRRVIVELPRHPFLHIRSIDPEQMTDQSGDSEIAYASYPSWLGIQFDVIVIAGRWRVECMLVARSVLAAGGIVLVEDGLHPRFNTVREFFDVIEESPRFLILRGKPRSAQEDVKAAQ